jgi:hypothetical protein
VEVAAYRQSRSILHRKRIERLAGIAGRNTDIAGLEARLRDRTSED